MEIFEPFRAIGYITSTVPLSVQRLGTETFVTVSVGKAWQIYNLLSLSLCMLFNRFDDVMFDVLFVYHFLVDGKARKLQNGKKISSLVLNLAYYLFY